MKKMRILVLIIILLMILEGCTGSSSSMFQVSFDAKNGSMVNDIQVEKGGKLPIQFSERNGYTLDGWYTSLNNGITLDEKWSFNTNTIESNLVLYAKWDLSTYTIAYQLDGGILSETYETEYTIESFTINLPTPSKDGFSFLGWFDNAQNDGQSITSVPSGSFGNRTFYAKWGELESYTIILDTDDGYLENTTFTAYEGVEINSLEEPRKIGYIFVGWQQANQSIAFPFIASGDMTLKAAYREMTPQELLFDYYVNVSSTGFWNYINGNNYVENNTNSNLIVEYYLDGRYIFNYFGYGFTVTFNLSNSTVKYEDTDGYYYTRDLLFKSYEGNVSMSYYLEIESLISQIASNMLFISETGKSSLLETYSRSLNYDDFNSSWSQIELLPDQHYKIYEQVVIDNVYITWTDYTISGGYVTWYFSITNNSDEVITYLRWNIDFINSSGQIIHSTWTNWSGLLQPGASTNKSKPVQYSYISSFSTLEIYITDISFN